MALGLGFLGANGFYQDTMNQQNQQLQQAIGNPYSYSSSTNSTITYGGLNSLSNNALPPAIDGALAALCQSQTTARQLAKPPKRAPKGVLSALVDEIDDWHGDVLERLAA